MKLDDVRALIQLRRPALDPVSRALGHCVTIEDLQAAAHRHWPAGVRGYVDGAADGEVTLEANRAAYRECELHPAPLRDVTRADTSAALLGSPSSLPFALGPTGYSRMMHTDGERAVARAAAAAGVPYTLSTMSTVSIEEVAAVAPGASLWFQLYVWRDRDLVCSLLARAREAGYHALMLTVDTPVTGLRTRDHRNGFMIPPQLTARTLLDMGAHPGWWTRLLMGEPITFANIPGHDESPSGVMEFAAKQFDPSVSWADLEELRRLWDGPLVVKGLVRPDDAVRARDAGVDAVVLSNHGGRQLDQAVAPLRVLPSVREAVGPDYEVLIDSGIRRGTDLAIALALGASGCLIGRPYLYGLGAGGERGVRLAIDLLAGELRRAMQLLGVTSIAQLRREGPELVSAPSGRGRRRDQRLVSETESASGVFSGGG
ncbi:MAG TPA: alpha-hydroxy acid oxidase [Segeticoccus sp.]|uniref:alpha-hydroxy acid oxidase n=1 Tax=Segeticoccus sp. TaxID=2706531 RepID=UPI002D804E3E|nr:alpha-hydroxy acid oxidase [Segeticoccus sp.]HET8599519.1 alpha-hydroxy acid oxidase [Segeticoccus sp.]